MTGSFLSGQFRFVAAGGDWYPDEVFDQDLDDDAFDLRLTGTGRLPDLGGAPVTSWLLARLARLTHGSLGLGDRQDGDGGGYVIEFFVYRLDLDTRWQGEAAAGQRFLFDMEEYRGPFEPDEPVASFQLQADMEGAAVVGRRAADCPAEEVLGALAAALLAEPTDLMAWELVVVDPEWTVDPELYRPWPDEDSRNEYGWDGFRFLGRDNIRDAE